MVRLPSCKHHPQLAGRLVAMSCPYPCVPVSLSPSRPPSYPVAAAITQPPCSGVASTQQPWLSWLMPKLWPISWAMVAAAPMGCSEWSCRGKGGWVSFGGGPQGPQEGPTAALGPQLGATRGGPVEEVGFGLLEAQRGKDLGLEGTAEKLGTWRACPKRQKPHAPRCQPEPGTTGSPGP